MRSWTIAAASCAAVMALAGCGGGSGSGGANANTPGRLDIGPASSDDQTIASGGLQQRMVTLHNGTSTAAHSLRVSVALDAHVLQLPLACDAAASSLNCRIAADGALEIPDLAAGASVTLRQQLRTKPGFSGSVANAWNVSSSSDAALSAQWQQTLRSRVADVSVALQSTTVTGDGATRALSYAITISNAGPDEARDVVWNQTPGIDMPWKSASCSASGGAACPASLSESIKIAQLPKGGSVSLVVNYGGRVGATVLDSELLFSEVQAAGDPDASNDRLLVRQANAPAHSDYDGMYDLVDFEGHAWRMTMNTQPGGYRELRFKNVSRELIAGFSIDITGLGLIKSSDDIPSHWYGEGTLQFWGESGRITNLVLGSVDFGRGLQPFVAAREMVADLSELEGLSYTVLGSRTDAAGKPVDAYARTGRFTGGALLVCESEALMALDACPTDQLRRYDAAVVGSELELMSSTEVLRLRSVRTASGPVLLRSERMQDDSGAIFWLGVPQISYQASLYPPDGGVAPATFASASGLSLPTGLSFDTNFEHPETLKFSGLGPLPNSYLLYFQQYPSSGDSYCGINGAVDPTVIAGLYQGDIVGRPFTAFSSPSAAPCYQGSIYLARTDEMVVLLGRKDGALMGRWMIVTQ